MNELLKQKKKDVMLIIYEATRNLTKVKKFYERKTKKQIVE